MLIRKLKVGDTLTIGDNIILQVKTVSDVGLRLAIAAPSEDRITHASDGEIVADTKLTA